MVAGEDPDGDAPLGERPQRFGGGGGEGVLEGDETPEVQAAFVDGRVVAGARGTLGGGDGQHPQPLVRLSCREREQLRALLVRQDTAFEYGLGGSLDDQGVRAEPARRAHYGGREPS